MRENYNIIKAKFTIIYEARLVEFGRHKGLKIPRPNSRSGSSPEAGTKLFMINLFNLNYFF